MGVAHSYKYNDFKNNYIKRKISLDFYTLKKYIFLSLFTFILCCTCTISVYGEENTIYYSQSRPPRFYGAKEVHLKVGEDFNVNDSRYRVFAIDFEDGDLTNKIEIKSNNVDIQHVGNYEVVYRVNDSHGNETLFETTVIISESPDSKVIRKVYNNFSTWNTTLQGILRGDHQDRQMLGIGIPEGKVAEVKVIEGPDLKISALTNDSHKDGKKMNITKNSYTQVSSVSDNSVPFVYTPLNTKEEADLEKEILLEVKLSDGIERIPYYHQGDDEVTFFDMWEKQVDRYAVIEGEALTVLVPYMDRKKLVNHWAKSFKTLDDFLLYYKKVRDRYDQLIGLERQPVDVLDQVVNTRFFVRANAHGIGAAYYGTDHIGVNNTSVASFFEANWGGLHELGHGYQGYLRDGAMQLGEVSNNFLAYEIQHDKEIYPWNDYYMDISRDEQKYNNQRLNENKTFYDVDITGKLYILENLLQSFNNKNAIYSEMNSWYRRQKSQGNSPRNEEAWIRAFAKVSDVNILPYFDSWGITVSEELREEISNIKHLKNSSILGDIIKDKTIIEEIKANKNRDTYSAITQSEFAEYGLNGSLTIKLSDEIYDLVQNKIIQIIDENNTINNITINQKEIVFRNIPIGTFSIVAPYINENYFIEPQWVTVRQNENSEVNVNYDKRTEFTYDGDQFYIQGIYNTDGIRGILNKDLTSLTIKLGAANLGNGSWPENQLYSSVSIINKEDGSIKKSYQVNGKGYYSYLDPDNLTQEIPIKIGDRIKIYHEQPYKISFVSGITNEVIKINATNTKETEYIITSTGFKKLDLSDTIYQDFIYQLKKNQTNIILRNAMNELSQEEIENRTVKINYKNNLILLYNSLLEIDKTEFTDFIEKIKKGGSPRLQSIFNNITLKQDEIIDLYSLIKAIDPEDGELTISPDNTKIETTFNPSIIGTYPIKYTVFDSDKNESTIELSIQVISNGNTNNSSSENTEVSEDTSTSDSVSTGTSGDTGTSDSVDAGTSGETSTSDSVNVEMSSKPSNNDSENINSESKEISKNSSLGNRGTRNFNDRSISKIDRDSDLTGGSRKNFSTEKLNESKKEFPRTSENSSLNRLFSILGIVLLLLCIIQKKYLKRIERAK